MENNVFNELNKVNVNEHVEKKNMGKTTLSYLSWTYAWTEVKKRYPDAVYEVVKFENGLPYSYDPETGYMVYTKVTIQGVTHEMWLPVMDSHNDTMLAKPYEVKTKYNSYTVAKCTMFDVNKTIMRCLTKNLAMFGLGLYIYAGEDLPQDEKSPSEKPATQQPSEELIKQTTILESFINDGALEGKQLQRAQQYINEGNLDGIKRTIAYIREQKESA